MEFTTEESPQTPRHNYLSVQQRKLPERGVLPISLVQYSDPVEWDPQSRLLTSEDNLKGYTGPSRKASVSSNARQAEGRGESPVVVQEQSPAITTNPRKPETRKRRSSLGVSRTQRTKWMIESQAIEPVADSYTRNILRQVLSTQQWKDSQGRHWRRYPVDEYVPQREDCTRVEQKLDEELRRRQARPTPLCPTREALYAQLFDEMIRQVTLICPQRGMLLARIRDEAYLTLAEYARITRVGSEVGGSEIYDNSAENIEASEAGVSEDMGADEDFAQTAKRLTKEIGHLKLQTQQLITQHSRLKEFYDTQSATQKQTREERVRRLEEEGEYLRSFMSQISKIRRDVWTQVSERSYQEDD